jgi:hypothetical protein
MHDQNSENINFVLGGMNNAAIISTEEMVGLVVHQRASYSQVG